MQWKGLVASRKVAGAFPAELHVHGAQRLPDFKEFCGSAEPPKRSLTNLALFTPGLLHHPNSPLSPVNLSEVVRLRRVGSSIDLPGCQC